MADSWASGVWIDGSSGSVRLDALGECLQPVAFGGLVGRAGGVDVGLFAGAGERDVGSFAGGVLADDQVRGVGGLALGGERVLDVGEP